MGSSIESGISSAASKAQGIGSSIESGIQGGINNVISQGESATNKVKSGFEKVLSVTDEIKGRISDDFELAESVFEVKDKIQDSIAKSKEEAQKKAEEIESRLPTTTNRRRLNPPIFSVHCFTRVPGLSVSSRTPSMRIITICSTGQTCA